MKSNILIIFVFVIISIIGQSALAQDTIVLDYFYSQKCGTCRFYTEEVIEPLEENYSGGVIFNKIDVNLNISNRQKWLNQGFLTYPAVVINNETKIPKRNLSYDEVDKYIKLYLQKQNVSKSFDSNTVDIPFFGGSINTSTLSLPVLTLVLGGLDSFNPCSFFILIFLLNLLLYVQSRKKMLLIGGIFIFFSGFFYLMFMFILYNSLILTSSYMDLISILAGLVAVTIGIINIKDFFYFKKGISLSLSKNKQNEIFKKVRNLIKTTYLPAIIGGAVFLAVTVNFYELLCTLGLPLIYTTRLTYENITLIESSIYIFFYNIIYIMPLIFILFVFIYTLGRRKISEIQGRKLKLLSGIMISMFGVFFIFDYTLLENFLTPILILLFSIISTLIISYIWSKFKIEKENN